MPGTVANRSKSGDSAQLEHSLVLLSWLNEQLGYGNTLQLLDDIKQAAEGFTPDGRSYVYLRLISRGDKPKALPWSIGRTFTSDCWNTRRAKGSAIWLYNRTFRGKSWKQRVCINLSPTNRWLSLVPSQTCPNCKMRRRPSF